jgi:hypothetical protein
MLARASMADVEDAADELDAASNAAVDLVRTGKLDEAERATRDLLEHFLYVHEHLPLADHTPRLANGAEVERGPSCASPMV